MHSIGAPTPSNEIGESSPYQLFILVQLISCEGKGSPQKRDPVAFLMNKKRGPGNEKDADEAIAYVWGGWTPPTNASHGGP